MASNSSPLLPNDPSTPSPAPAPAPAPPPVNPKGLLTGRKILAYPSGTLPAALRTIGDRTALKRANIASVGDMPKAGNVSVAQFFQNNTSAFALTFEELDVMVVKDVSVLGGISPATVGGAGQMPIIGDEHYVYPVSQGLSVDSLSLDELRRLDERIQEILRAHPPAAPDSRPADVGGQKSWGLNAVQAIGSRFTGKNIRVAVIDTGIDPDHPDLKGKIAHSWSFDNGPVNDDMGHGTHVAGTIAGPRSNPLAFGMAPDVQLYIAKVFRGDGTGGTDSDVIGAINWAIQNKCHVANMSLSSSQILPPGTKFDPAFEVIAQNALKKNLLLVAAAGNLGDTNQFGQRTGVRNNPPAPVGHPANCPSVLAVAALSPDLQVAVFSNAGQADPSNGQINFAGPGEEIVSSWPTDLSVPSGEEAPGLTGSYAMLSGTSMASPHIAGLAALMAEKLGGTGGLPLWQALSLGPVDPLTGLSRRDVGFGMLLASRS